MMLDALIKQYISVNTRLVIPDFGAFIRKDTGEVVFVEFLKKDDQVLTSLLKSKLSLNEVQSKNFIEDYILSVKRSVGTTGKYVIPGLGIIATDQNGLYILNYSPGVTKQDGEESISSPDIQQRPTTAQGIQQDKAEPSGETTHILENKAAVSQKNTQQTETQPAAQNGVVNKVKESKNHVVTGSPQESRRTAEARQEPASAQRAEDRMYSSDPRRPESKKEARSGASGAAKVADSRPEPARTASAPRPKPVDYRSGKKRMDIIMIIAVAVALIAIGSMIYGMLVEKNPVINIEPTNPVEQIFEEGENAEAENALQPE